MVWLLFGFVLIIAIGIYGKQMNRQVEDLGLRKGTDHLAQIRAKRRGRKRRPR